MCHVPRSLSVKRKGGAIKGRCVLVLVLELIHVTDISVTNFISSHDIA